MLTKAKYLLILTLVLSSFFGGCVSNTCPKTEAKQRADVVVADVPEPGEQAVEGSSLRTPEIVWNPEVELLDTEGAGKLYQVGEHLVCVMEGTHEEMGYQHGRLLAKHIAHIMREGYLEKALWSRGYTREYVMAESERMEKHFPPEYIEELKGLVKGLQAAGFEDATYETLTQAEKQLLESNRAAYEEARLALTQAEILHYGPDAPPGCSNFACWGRWTTDGRLLHGRNLDWSILGGAQEDAVILVWRPKGGSPFMMLSWSGAIGSVTGM
ncbi:MAG TPA: hypothetical protein ENN80_05100, partial [Candidatus Hydrogenedentes bacterium]|nr:hypothetical protein [Candidatus Hydrogenedentota bacterium]